MWLPILETYEDKFKNTLTLSRLVSSHRVRSGLGSVSYWGNGLPQGSLACFKEEVVMVVREARPHMCLESETV